MIIFGMNLPLQEFMLLGLIVFLIYIPISIGVIIYLLFRIKKLKTKEN